MPAKDDILSQNKPLALPAAPSMARLFPPVEESSTLLLTCRRGDYSASRIAHAVEDCDAHLLNLNVTSDTESLDNRIAVEIRVSHRNPVSVARSLERYGYEVDDVDVRAMDDDVIQARVAELLHYLEE
ncbi:MAG: hypothetical protein NC221_07100 [Duncaniella sp.]|nr:hypothetical protein [Muribaculum sp.]MCM1255869.1 hypothetical protein [Duncaniella sp.]